MIDFLLTFRKKTIQSAVRQFCVEVEQILSIQQIAVETGHSKNYLETTDKLGESLASQLNNLLFTLDLNRKSNLFLERYLPRRNPLPPSKLAFADLFAGCGGLSIGLEKAGFSLVFANELELEIAETHFFNHSLPTDNYWVGDINSLIQEPDKIREKISNLFLVAGGPPCQGFSTANRQRLIDDPRNHLYKSYLRFLQIAQPEWFIIENVRGMAKKESEIRDDISNILGTSYRCNSALLNAKDFGIPQNRERFFLIGTRSGKDPGAVFTAMAKKRRSPFSLWEAIEDLPPLGPKTIRNDNSIENEQIGYTLKAHSYQKTPYLDFVNDGIRLEYLFNHKNRFNNERDIEIFSRLPQGGDSLHESIQDIMPYHQRNRIFKDKYFKLREDAVCKTITAHMKFDCNMYIHPRQPRGLSPREAARIQTFPDSFFFRGPQNSWYKQIGNAVPVKLAELLGRSLIEVAGL
jgi:DNA (cytosine-5)-methyltransferase 1